MKAQATPSKNEGQVVQTTSHRRHSYQKVLDGRKQPIRGLWRRNGQFIARLSVEDEHGRKQTRWKLLEGVATVPEAQKALAKLHDQRDNNRLPVMKRTPKLADYTKSYFEYYEQVKDAKRPATLAKEQVAMRMWNAHMGETRLDRITRAQINAFIAKRQGAGTSGRTVNLDVIGLRNVLNRAVEDGWLKYLPTENLRPLKWTPKKRELVTTADLAKLTEAAFQPVYFKSRLAKDGEQGRPLKNARQFADYLWLMAYTGARRNEALRLRWQDVDFARQQITIGADGLSKNREERKVNFNPKLEAHLREMFERRAPDSQFLFPSPQRGDQDACAKTFVESLRLARKAAGMAGFGFHDCRHFFISFGVMSGLDFMTIASWVGHKDGGILIGKVYGHLADDHKKRQAQRINFEPVIVPLPEAATA